ncbi:L-fuculokinase [Pasteurellaceae bacterium USgator11]|nr:L-fuculokinase [Pasteurellaceae bacterium UScroc12]TNG95924.1 L-fuculokinase [Pasteurellaceae bacterium USgator41]TNG98003.1 L-fuculokinase [Pasteurellaceae bacterium UScroc31]TNH03016.1 L-fuculokinase [Pasteurellaceae bacterium USgator11]
MPIVLIFDCGATNTRTIALNEKGQILAAHHITSNTKVGAESTDYHIWDFAEICDKLSECARHVVVQLSHKHYDIQEIIGISVTTFGVDGAPFDRDGKQIYPIISWKCPRTLPIMQNISNYFEIEKLYTCNGIGLYSFNTLFKLLWLKENQTEIYQKMDKFVFISSMLTHWLTGVFSTDKTMAGTSMLTNLQSGTWDPSILSVLDLTEHHFPLIVEAGTPIGELQADVAHQMGLPAGIPVISCGHDTQFAIFGSGAKPNQPVLSSGTWEILMARTAKIEPHFDLIHHGLTTEFDTKTGYYTPGVQWLGSGVLEWVGKVFYRDVFDTPHYYPTMISEAEAVPLGTNGLEWHGNFNNAEDFARRGSIRGLSLHSERGQIYRAALEYMAYQLKCGLQTLQQVSHFQAERLICVGGGSKNRLWNQIRADVLGIPIEIVDVAEATVLGAAMFTFAGAQYYQNADVAQQQMQPQRNTIKPSADSPAYQQWLANYIQHGANPC